MEFHGLPPHLFTDDPSASSSQARIQVDVAQTGFWLAHHQRISYEYDIANATTQVLKFTSPVDFILQYQNLSCDTGAIRFRAFRAADGTEGGLFSTQILVSGSNGMNTAPEYSNEVTISTGGTFTPTGGVEPREVIRLRVSSATAQQTSVTGAAADERGLPPGSYYLLMENIAGSGSSTGVYDLRWEERPASLNAWLTDKFGNY